MLAACIAACAMHIVAAGGGLSWGVICTALSKQCSSVADDHMPSHAGEICDIEAGVLETVNDNTKMCFTEMRKT
jgi:hypothetical protein